MATTRFCTHCTQHRPLAWFRGKGDLCEGHRMINLAAKAILRAKKQQLDGEKWLRLKEAGEQVQMLVDQRIREAYDK
jgi:hypothetical protein